MNVNSYPVYSVLEQRRFWTVSLVQGDGCLLLRKQLDIRMPGDGSNALGFEQRERVKGRVLAEVRYLNTFSHPNVEKVVDQPDWDAEAPAFTLRYRPVTLVDIIRDRNLRGQWQARRLAFADVSDYMRTALSALAHVHAQGVAHGNIRPATFALAEDGALVLSGFQFAQGRWESFIKASGGEGTDPFMAPELGGEGQGPSVRADLYALGVIAHRMLLGRPPNESRLPLKSIDPEIPQALSHWIDMMLRQNPEERPSSAEEIREGLNA